MLLLLLCGCTKTVTKAELDARSTAGEHFTFPDQTYYVGSDDRYDYFVIRTWGNGPKNWYRVLRTEGVMTNRFPLTKDETKWIGGYGLTGLLTNSIHMDVTNRVGESK
jgi:hypothetical protein